MLARILILAVLALILISLFSALAMLFRNKTDSARMVKALTVRISLSVFLFVALLLSLRFGLIHPGA